MALRWILRTVVLLLVCLTTSLRADTFTYEDEDGETVEVEARLAGSGQGLHALELADGEIRLVPQAAVSKRVAAEGPEPIGVDAMAEKLTEQFGAEKFRFHKEGSFVVGLVLSAPLPKKSESRARSFLKKAGRFMKSVEGNFTTFVKKMKIPYEESAYPLVVLIFEADVDFEKYAVETTGGRGLSAGNILGFYSKLSNYLVLRMSECRSFAVPLHEAIHQQVYNRRVLQRLAPSPVWFNEGIATGFEGNGDKIKVGPLKINSSFAKHARKFSRVKWSTIVEEDSAFHGDILAGEAYTHAWALHWLLVSKHKSEYTKYVKLLAQKQPLDDDDADARRNEFQEAFGKSVTDLQNSFPRVLQAGIKQQKLNFNERKTVGLSVTHSGLAEVKVSAVQQGLLGGLLVKGNARNISPIRDMTFHITVETDSGMYADWVLPRLKMNRTVSLQQQRVGKLMKNGRGGSSRTFRVKVRAVAPESAEAQRWKRGGPPVPVFGG